MNRRWLDPPPADPSSDLLALCAGDALLAHLLWTRGYRDPDAVRGFLSPADYVPAPPEALPDLVKASATLQRAIEQETPILIWGDFDVDGQTATALLLDGLTRLGAKVSYYLPDRATESHGIKLASLQRELDHSQAAILLTCDTGVTEFESLDYATSIGLQVIVTDHHELADGRLPTPPILTVNPHRLPASHPLSSLPGVGVAFKLMQHLYTSLGKERKLSALLDLVALGIVGDVATQTADTRYLLQRGLDELRHTGRIGLQALLDVARVNAATMTAEQIGFQIAPRLNAAGRIGDARRSVELLTTHKSEDAHLIAQQLEGLNAKRRLDTQQIEAAALDMLTNDPSLLRDAVLVLHHANWHPGLVGIVANSLAERYTRPVILLAGEPIARGSARAPDGYDIFSPLASHSDLLNTFGGHPGAAGLSLPVQKIPQLRKLVSQSLRQTQEVPEIPALQIDALVTLDQLTLDLAGRIARLAPFGQGNPRPVIAVNDLSLDHAAIIGRQELHRKITVQDREGRAQTLLWWHSSKEQLPDGRFDVAFNVGISERGELELILLDWRQREAPLVEIKREIVIHDWRQERDPRAKLEEISSTTPEAIIWAESYSRQQFPQYTRRAELAPAPTLIVFTPPSDADALRCAIDAVQPTQIHLFNMPPPIGSTDDLMRQLKRAAANVIEARAGVEAIDVIAGALAASPAVVMTGLALLAARGEIGALSFARGKARISPAETGTGVDQHSDPAQQQAALVRFQAAVSEMMAYRRFYSKTEASEVIRG